MIPVLKADISSNFAKINDISNKDNNNLLISLIYLHHQIHLHNLDITPLFVATMVLI
jgi:hypothetical protein